jgi:hypothetical protein
MKNNVKNITIFFIALITFVVLPLTTQAHGGVEKHSGNIIVFLNQNPLSPLIGEPVDFAFKIVDRNNTVLKNISATITLTDTFTGDESKDKEVFKKEVTTDANGSFEFSYTFPNSDYFDIDIGVTDPSSGKTEEVGFLVQPRAIPTRSENFFIISIVIGIIVGFSIARVYDRQKNKVN